MTAVRMDGKVLAAKVREGVAREVAELGHVGLATVLVGDDEASHVYIAAKHKAATEAGIDARDVRLPADTSEADVLALVDRLNNDPEVDGILVQLTLPSHMSETMQCLANKLAHSVNNRQDPPQIRVSIRHLPIRQAEHNDVFVHAADVVFQAVFD